MLYPGEIHKYIFTNDWFNPSDPKQKAEVTQRFAQITNSKKKDEFRALLRSLQASALETALFGDVEASIPEPDFSRLPSDEAIIKKFNKYVSDYSYFKNPTFRNKAQQDFLAFFKVSKIFGDFIENNNNEPNDYNAYENAFKMTVMFAGYPATNRFAGVDEFLKKYIKTKDIIHDTFYRDIPENTDSEFNLQKWRKFIKEGGPEVIALFPNAPDIQKNLGRDPQNIGEVKKTLEKMQYQRSAEYPELSKLCKSFNVREKYFNRALEIEKQRRALAPQPDLLPEAPQVSRGIDNLYNYHFIRLARTDPRIYLQGFYTNSCLNIGDNGEFCIRDGQLLTHNGFYAHYRSYAEGSTADIKNHDGTINNKEYDLIGEHYAPLTFHANLLLDSLEGRNPNTDNPTMVKNTKAFAKQIADAPGDIVRVLSGIGGQTPKELYGEIVDDPEIMFEGKQYPDSRTQAVIYCNETKKKQIDEDLKNIVKALEIAGLFVGLEQVETTKNLFTHSQLSNSYFHLRFFQSFLKDIHKFKLIRFFLEQMQGPNYLTRFNWNPAYSWDVLAILDQNNLLNEATITLYNKHIGHRYILNILIGMKHLADHKLLSDKTFDLLIKMPGTKKVGETFETYLESVVFFLQNGLLNEEQISEAYANNQVGFTDFYETIADLSEDDIPSRDKLIQIFLSDPVVAYQVCDALALLEIEDIGAPYNDLLIKNAYSAQIYEIVHGLSWLNSKKLLSNIQITEFIATIAPENFSAISHILPAINAATPLTPEILRDLQDYQNSFKKLEFIFTGLAGAKQLDSILIDKIMSTPLTAYREWNFYTDKGIISPHFLGSVLRMSDEQRDNLAEVFEHLSMFHIDQQRLRMLADIGTTTLLSNSKNLLNNTDTKKLQDQVDSLLINGYLRTHSELANDARKVRSDSKDYILLELALNHPLSFLIESKKSEKIPVTSKYILLLAENESSDRYRVTSTGIMGLVQEQLLIIESNIVSNVDNTSILEQCAQVITRGNNDIIEVGIIPLDKTKASNYSRYINETKLSDLKTKISTCLNHLKDKRFFYGFEVVTPIFTDVNFVRKFSNLYLLERLLNNDNLFSNTKLYFQTLQNDYPYQIMKLSSSIMSVIQLFVFLNQFNFLNETIIKNLMKNSSHIYLSNNFLKIFNKLDDLGALNLTYINYFFTLTDESQLEQFEQFIGVLSYGDILLSSEICTLFDKKIDEALEINTIYSIFVYLKKLDPKLTDELFETIKNHPVPVAQNIVFALGDLTNSNAMNPLVFQLAVANVINHSASTITEKGETWPNLKDHYLTYAWGANKFQESLLKNPTIQSILSHTYPEGVYTTCLIISSLERNKLIIPEVLTLFANRVPTWTDEQLKSIATQTATFSKGSLSEELFKKIIDAPEPVRAQIDRLDSLHLLNSKLITSLHEMSFEDMNKVTELLIFLKNSCKIDPEKLNTFTKLDLLELLKYVEILQRCENDVTATQAKWQQLSPTFSGKRKTFIESSAPQTSPEVDSKQQPPKPEM